VRRNDAKAILPLPALDARFEVLNRVRLVDVEDEFAPEQGIQDGYLLRRLSVKGIALCPTWPPLPSWDTARVGKSSAQGI